MIGAKTKGKEVFSYLDVGAAGAADDRTRYVVEIERTEVAGGATTVTYQHVDTMAQAAPDGPDPLGDLDLRGVKADLPMAMPYSHIHFGVWAALGEPNAKGVQKLTDLGIGFVQSLPEGDGPTERLGIGSVTYNGDWVAVVQRRNSAGSGAFTMYDGGATMTADFDKDKFTAALTGLATLEGTLDGNGFSGMESPKAISHPDLDKTGDFDGEFSGGIYGAKGEEAAGVFDFAGGESGSFRGAFGGTNQK